MEKICNGLRVHISSVILQVMLSCMNFIIFFFYQKILNKFYIFVKRWMYDTTLNCIMQHQRVMNERRRRQIIDHKLQTIGSNVNLCVCVCHVCTFKDIRRRRRNFLKNHRRAFITFHLTLPCLMAMACCILFVVCMCVLCIHM